MKKCTVMLILLLLCTSLFPGILLAAEERDTSFEESLAADLKALGLFQGVSATSFELNRAPTRIEALVMLIRVLGKEADALSGTWTHPFIDVPKWADNYVGYAYENGLTNGSSQTEFGTGNATAATYLTFVLRALGYSDTNGEDFTWDDPFLLAQSIGILPSSVDTACFWRADIVSVSYAALPVCLKGSNQTLAQLLISANAFTQEAYSKHYEKNTDTPKEAPEQIIIGEANYHGHVYTGGQYSSKYHYEADCAGENSHEITWEDVGKRGLKPCGTCVLK